MDISNTPWIVFVLLIVICVLLVWRRRTRRPMIEFKCLEHMCPLDNWNAKERIWTCSSNEACDVFVDADIREQYEGVKPPR